MNVHRLPGNPPQVGRGPRTCRPLHHRAIAQATWLLPWRRALQWAGGLAALVAVFALGVHGSAASHSFTITSPPSWVETLALTADDAKDSSTKAAYLLLDHQIHVSAGTVERYERRAKKVFTAAALADAAQIAIEFEPSYQKLAIHHVRIQRGAQVIDALKPGEIKVIQQEDELDQQLYNGRLSALIVLNDVRQGDIIDYAYTITGSNPVLAGRYADSYVLADTLPVARLRWRLLYPTQRKIDYKIRGVELTTAIRQLGAETECQWQRDTVAAAQYEDDAPSWYEPLPTVQLSEFATWGDVVSWALPLYQLKGAPNAALTRQIEQWRTRLATGEERMRAALQFVQDDVRYTGIEMGPYSHLPNQPAVVFTRRFGDCKDKSLLLVTILNAFGIDAAPALTNTEAQHAIAEYQPSPYAFNHVIVRAVLEGRTYWLDPTITLQRGSLSARYNPEYKRALVIRDGNGELDEIPPPTPAEPTTVVKEVYTLEANRQSALLEVATTYRAADADSMRYRLARTAIAEIGRLYLNYYADSDPNIEQLALPHADDDQEANVMVITEHYRIPDFWSNSKRQFGAHRIYEEMTKPNIARRTAPLSISHPVNISQSIEVHFVEPLTVPKDSTSINDGFIHYEFHAAMSGNTLKLDYAYQSLADEVPAAQVAKHLAVVEKVQNTLGYSITPASDSMDSTSAVVGLAVLGLVFGPFIVFGTVKGVKRLRAGKRRQEFKDKSRDKTLAAPGGSPEVAIPLAHESELSVQVGALRCNCGESYYKPGTPLYQQGLTFDGRRLLLVQLQCERCRQPRDMYYAPPLTRAQG
ncbi:MAG: DUF3857 domain-containing transglutaminase family protein [Blastocatellia bacterium]